MKGHAGKSKTLAVQQLVALASYTFELSNYVQSAKRKASQELPCTLLHNRKLINTKPYLIFIAILSPMAKH